MTRIAGTTASRPPSSPWCAIWEAGGTSLPGAVVMERTFGRLAADRACVLAVFEEHNRMVRETIAPERLLVFDVREGWPSGGDRNAGMMPAMAIGNCDHARDPSALASPAQHAPRFGRRTIKPSQHHGAVRARPVSRNSLGLWASMEMRG